MYKLGYISTLTKGVPKSCNPPPPYQAGMEFCDTPHFDRLYIYREQPRILIFT